MPSHWSAKCGMKSSPSNKKRKSVQNDFTSFVNTFKNGETKWLRKPRQTSASNQLNKEIELSNLKLKLPEPVPLPERIDGFIWFRCDRVKATMAAAKELKKQMDKLKKALSKRVQRRNIHFAMSSLLRVNSAYLKSNGIAWSLVEVGIQSLKKKFQMGCYDVFHMRWIGRFRFICIC